jgi:hypothetical protein
MEQENMTKKGFGAVGGNKGHRGTIGVGKKDSEVDV